MRQLTLISHYGKKPPEFGNLLSRCQRVVSDFKGIGFIPYDLRQIHGTIIGLEKADGSHMDDLNLLRHRNIRKKMDLANFLQSICLSDKLPLQVQVAGFVNDDYPFESRGKRPYERSFSIQGRHLIIVGWPVDRNISNELLWDIQNLAREADPYPNTLDTLRKTAQAFNILHAYHRNPTDVDNDFYLRVGLIRPKSSDSRTKRELEEKVRKFLSSKEPVILDITLSDLSVAAYEKDTLPLRTTKVRSLARLCPVWDPIENL